MDNNKKLIPIIVTIVVLAGGAGFWYWSQKRSEVKETSTETSATEIKDGLGAEAFKKTNNPLSNELPETNPFYVDTNPFK